MHGNADIRDDDDRLVNSKLGFLEPDSLSPCATCPVRATSFCDVLIGGPVRDQPLTQYHETAARREILFERDKSQVDKYVICEGWAFRFRRFEDGRRYILNFLIAGDLVAKLPGFSLQALTDIRFCKYARDEIMDRIKQEPRVYDACTAHRVAERNGFAARAAALAQFSAAGRIAQLIVSLRDRLDARGMVRNESFAFPLRQTHIADAAGLTTVHVSRTIGTFRKDEILAIGNGNLTILNLAKLRRIAECN